MPYARVGVRVVLNAAQVVIDVHRTSVECFGRCVACGNAWLCLAQRRAGSTFYDAGRLPRRRPVPLVDAVGVRWTPVDWFGSGAVSTAARGGPPPRAWRLREAVG